MSLMNWIKKNMLQTTDRPDCEMADCPRPSKIGCDGYCQDCYSNLHQYHLLTELRNIRDSINVLAEALSTVSVAQQPTDVDAQESRPRRSNATSKERRSAVEAAPTFMPEIKAPKAKLNTGNGGISSRESD